MPRSEHCDSISASTNRLWLILHMTGCVLIFDLDIRLSLGEWPFAQKTVPQAFLVLYAALYALSQRRYAKILSD